MSKVTTLTQNTQFHRVYYKGKSCASPILVTYALKSREDDVRYGITASTKIGGAVERNRCRRIIKAAFTSMSDKVNGSWDLVFVARFKTNFSSSPEIAKVMEKQLTELGVIER